MKPKKKVKVKKVKKVKAWAVWLLDKKDFSGCIPMVFDDKNKRTMIQRNSGLFSTFELKKFAQMYAKELHKKGTYKIIPCEITYHEPRYNKKMSDV